MTDFHIEIAAQLDLLINSSNDSTGQQNSFKEITDKIKKRPFIYSYIRDVIDAVEKSNNDSKSEFQENIKIIIKRLDYFGFWLGSKNQTIELIEQNKINPEQIKPHIRFSDEDYECFYEKQNESVSIRMQSHKKTPFNKFKSFTRLVFRKHYSHIIRKSHAINVIETYIGLLENLEIPINRKWLDIGCGVGLIANAVNSKRHASHQWDIHGCDLQENKVQVANNRACKNRYFFQENVLTKLKENASDKDQYDVLSMFEFCEHFADPYTIIENIAKSEFKVMVIATPLEQKFKNIKDVNQDPVHLWSFSAQAIVKILTELGLKVIYHSETNVGSYTQGLDWLTVVAVKPSVYELFANK